MRKKNHNEKLQKDRPTRHFRLLELFVMVKRQKEMFSFFFISVCGVKYMQKESKASS